MELLDEGRLIEGGALVGVLDRAIKEYAPESDTFDVTILLGGESTRIPFRRLCDGKELEDLQEDAVKWAQSLMPKRHGKMKVSPMSPEMAKWFVPKPAVLAKVYIVAKLALEPSFKSEASVMQLYRRAWPIFNSVVSQIDLALTNQLFESENRDYEDEGKDSAPSPTTA